MQTKGLNKIVMVLLVLLSLAIIVAPVSAGYSSVKGMLKDADTQKPLSGTVTLTNDSNQLSNRCDVQADGVITFNDVYTTTYMLIARSDGYKTNARQITLNVGQNPDIEILMYSASTTPGGISGKVVDNYTNPMGGVSITVSNTTTFTTTVLTSDSDGSYSVQGLSPDQYTVTAQMAGYQTQSNTVIVSPGKTVEQGFTMSAEEFSKFDTSGLSKPEKKYELTAIVIDRDTKEAIKEATIKLTYKPSYTGDTYAFTKQYTSNSNDGVFEIADTSDPKETLVDGEYIIEVSANGYTTYTGEQSLYKSYQIGTNYELVSVNSPYSSDSPFIKQPEKPKSSNPLVKFWNWFSSIF